MGAGSAPRAAGLPLALTVRPAVAVPFHVPFRSRRIRPASLVLRLAVLLLPLAACSDRDAEGGTLVADAGQREARREPPVIAAPAAPYRAAPVATAGGVTGVVRVEGALPTDTTVRPTMDRRTCGESFVDRTITGSAAGLGDVVVWLADVRGGKPLPLARRFTVTNERCRVEPRVQAVLAGGTLNVRSADRVVHRTRVVRQGAGEVVARYEHNDFGQVVPDDDVLATPGLLELRSDVHPWTRGFVAVFDHPYFAVTTGNGRFALDDVPPGEYTLAAWHERFGRTEQRVTVTAGAPTAVTLAFRADSTSVALPAGTPGAALAGEPKAPAAARAEAPR